MAFGIRVNTETIKPNKEGNLLTLSRNRGLNKGPRFELANLISICILKELADEQMSVKRSVLLPALAEGQICGSRRIVPLQNNLSAFLCPAKNKPRTGMLDATSSEL